MNGSWRCTAAHRRLLRQHGLLSRTMCVAYLRAYTAARWLVYGFQSRTLDLMHPRAHRVAWAAARYLGERNG